MIKIFLTLMLTVLTAGCISPRRYNTHTPAQPVRNALQREFDSIPAPAGAAIPIAVYSFADKTGQRKSSGNTAATSFSSAVTQGAEVYLIQALQTVGQRRWFRVLERVGIDDISRERQLIRQMREAYQGKEAQPLPAMIFAGVIVEGGIIGYDSNLTTGGAGVSVFGIGSTTQYQSDSVDNL